MKVNSFVKGYEKAEDKDAYVQEKIKFSKYAPFNTKVAYAESIVANTSTYENGLVNRDTVRCQLMTDWSLLRLYTDLQLDPEKIIEDYDALGSCGALEKILSIIDSDTDGYNLRTYVHCKEEDRDYNESEIHNFIAKCIVSLSPMVTPLLSTIVDTLNNVDKDAITQIIADKIGEYNEVADADEVASSEE
jgi:hypothetical protein